ncbi:hypothetical protein [Herbiconiux liukaitaii]|uniref:hypothetical protein n=1 Tax=Herbiconiux liukaitaii TaxID=3342799 RepID=UPI0035B7AAD3
MPNGTLWTRPRVNGVLPEDRRALEDFVPDDIVFHFGGPYVRAVCRVVAPATDALRPEGYPYGPNETSANDDGRLVRVELIAGDLRLHRNRVAELITHGSPGPLSRYGVPREAYISPLSDQDADALLQELDLAVPERHLSGRPHEDWPAGSGATDAEAIARIRKEQGSLRAHLLRGRTLAPCALCGKETPATFLVAGHIVPRSEISDEDRWKFDEIAMLVCLFGCDALFEQGYVAIDGTGVVSPGRRADDERLEEEIGARIGRKAIGWHEQNAATFEKPFLNHRSRLEV